MSSVHQLLEEVQAFPQDERQMQVRQEASWKAAASLLITYVVIAVGYMAMGKLVPFTLQLLFSVPFLVMLFTTIRHEGYHFLIPGIKETEGSLQQSASIRSLPWLILLYGMVIIPFGVITDSLYLLHINRSLAAVGSYTTILAVSGSIILSYFVAKGIKAGEAAVLWLVGYIGLMNLFFTSMTMLHTLFPKKAEHILGIEFFGNDPVPEYSSPLFIIQFVLKVWLVGVLITKGWTIIRQGRQYATETEVEVPRGLLDRFHKDSPMPYLVQNAGATLILALINYLTRNHSNVISAVNIFAGFASITYIFGLITLLLQWGDRLKNRRAWILAIVLFLLNIATHFIYLLPSY
jgi:hypothetical protein